MSQVSFPRPISMHAPGVIFLVRHGQCRSNLEWPIENYSDSIDGLTSMGETQAAGLGKCLVEYFPSTVWKVHTSALRRAIETGTIISGITGSKLSQPDPRLNEYSAQKETYDGLLKRVNSFLDHLSLIEISENERNLVVTHGHVLEFLLCHSLGVEMNPIIKGDHAGQKGLITHSNCGLSAFFRGELLLWNSHLHL